VKKFHLAAEECVTVQSTPEEITAANRLQLRCIAVSGRHTRKELMNSDLIVDSLTNLTPVNLEHLTEAYLPEPALNRRKYLEKLKGLK
jgi:beta-phosphoglucomutase-like phosphatase (HAD superfamily)